MGIGAFALVGLYGGDYLFPADAEDVAESKAEPTPAARV